MLVVCWSYVQSMLKVFSLNMFFVWGVLRYVGMLKIRKDYMSGIVFQIWQFFLTNLQSNPFPDNVPGLQERAGRPQCKITIIVKNLKFLLHI